MFRFPGLVVGDNFGAMNSSTTRLLDKAQAGDRTAVDQLFERHRPRLRRMINVRLDQALRNRIDDSDVVQETLALASAKLPSYLKKRSIAFYPWLRSIAWEKLIDLRREHIDAKKRSVTREAANVFELPDNSAMNLASCLIASGTHPSGHLLKQEVQARVREALDQLPTDDRELLVLKYLERLPTSEIAVIMACSDKSIRSRHRRALEHLRTLLDDGLENTR